MRELTINEVLKLDDKEVIPSIRGVVSGVYARKEGIHAQHGPWSFQDLKLSQGGTDIYVKVESHEDLSYVKGKEVVIHCWKSDKGMSGVYAFDDTYKGETRRKIRVTKSGTIADSSAAGAPAASNDAPDGPPQNKTAPAATHTASRGNEMSELHVRKGLNQLANLDIQCRMAVEYVRHKLVEAGITMSDDEVQARWSSYYIQATRENWHKAMPTGDYDLGKSKAPVEAPKTSVASEPVECDDEAPF